MTGAPKRFDPSALLGSPPKPAAAAAPPPAPGPVITQHYERISAYVRSDQRDWLLEAASTGMRNATVSDIVRVALDYFIRHAAEHDLDLPGVVIEAAQADIRDGFTGRGKVGLPKRYRSRPPRAISSRP